MPPFHVERTPNHPVLESLEPTKWHRLPLVFCVLLLVACQPPEKSEEARQSDAVQHEQEAARAADTAKPTQAVAADSATNDDVRLGPDGQRVEWAALAAEPAPLASARKGQATWAADLVGRIEARWQSRTARRLYMQVDKPLYNPGETIWVRVWDVRAADLGAPAKTEGVTLELVTPSGGVSGKVDVKAERGRAHHAFDVAKGAVGGESTIRATTHDGVSAQRPVFVNAFVVPRVQKELECVRKAYGPNDDVQADLQLRSKDGAPLANKTVKVVARVDGEELPATQATTGDDGRATVSAALPALIEVGDGVLTVMVEDGGVTESVSKRIPIILKKVRFELFPEGGDLVLGLESRVYFEAKRPIGNPADVEGRVVDDRGELVAQFESYRDGRGRFAFTPAAGRSYRAEITKPEGVAETFILPDAKAHGCVLRACVSCMRRHAAAACGEGDVLSSRAPQPMAFPGNSPCRKEHAPSCVFLHYRFTADRAQPEMRATSSRGASHAWRAHTSDAAKRSLTAVRLPSCGPASPRTASREERPHEPTRGGTPGCGSDGR